MRAFSSNKLSYFRILFWKINLSFPLSLSGHGCNSFSASAHNVTVLLCFLTTTRLASTALLLQQFNLLRTVFLSSRHSFDSNMPLSPHTYNLLSLTSCVTINVRLQLTSREFSAIFSVFFSSFSVLQCSHHPPLPPPPPPP